MKDCLSNYVILPNGISMSYNIWKYWNPQDILHESKIDYLTKIIKSKRSSPLEKINAQKQLTKLRKIS